MMANLIGILLLLVLAVAGMVCFGKMVNDDRPSDEKKSG